MSGINIPGLVALIIFYLLILVVGILASWLKTRKGSDKNETDNVMVAGRSLGIFVGIFTLTATWVGGGYINGTAEIVYDVGLIHAQAPVGYAVSLIVGGLFFAGPMRKARYLTMLDPFQNKYGRRVGGLLYIPALLGELFWSGAILSALGASVSVIMDIDLSISIIVSSAIAIVYTFFGGLYAVAYTDVVQLICIAFGLSLCIPFAWKNKEEVCWETDIYAKTNSSSLNWTCPSDACFGVFYNRTTCDNSSGLNLTKVFDENWDWVGKIDPNSLGTYIDSFILLILGGVPWQVYFQRVLAVDKVWKAQALSVAAALCCLIMGIPSVLIGVIARHTDWDKTGYGLAKLQGNKQVVLPAVIQYLTPTAVSFFGLGAISAAVMSSADSSILSAASMFSHNIYRNIFFHKASDKQLLWVLRISILIVGILATVMALVVKSVYALWYSCADLVYVILFPQLVGVIYFPFINSYGVLAGYAAGLILRILGGDSLLGIPAVINFDPNTPFKTIAMLLNFLTTVLVSALAVLICGKKRKLDFLRCFVDKNPHLGPSNSMEIPSRSSERIGVENPAFQSLKSLCEKE